MRPTCSCGGISKTVVNRRIGNTGSVPLDSPQAARIRHVFLAWNGRADLQTTRDVAATPSRGETADIVESAAKLGRPSRSTIGRTFRQTRMRSWGASMCADVRASEAVDLLLRSAQINIS